jgi:hypothetical protein
MSILTKVLSVVALTCITLVVACNHKAKQSKIIAASADSKGTHPANATVNGPVAVTCVSATDDSGNATPPACVIEAPGTNGVVDIGHKVEIETSHEPAGRGPQSEALPARRRHK